MSPRLRPGAVLYEIPDGSWRCYEAGAAGETFLRVHAAGGQLRLLQQVLHGATTLEEAIAATDDPGGLHDLLAAFREQGLLAAEPPDGGGEHGADEHPGAAASGDGPCAPCARAHVRVDGDTPIAEVVAAQLAGHAGTVTRGPAAGDALDGVDVLLVCAGWLTDERWQRLDEGCALAGIPWHMCHAEGVWLVVGPCALPGRGPRYDDTRARRLAAAAFPDEMLAHWQALEGGIPLPDVPWPDRGTQLVVAGLLVADTCAALSGRPLPGEGVQTVVDGRTGALSRHGVRPLPDLQAATS